MPIVKCPECEKKLKVADASVGKKVKCSCGNVFVAQADGEPAASKPSASAAPAPVADKVMVACTECSAKLKVAASSLGKKMKCPKCASVFVASDEDASPPKSVKKAPPPVSEEDSLEEEAPTVPMAKPKKLEEDDLFAFGQEEVDAESSREDESGENEFDVKPKGKAKPKKEDDEEDDERPKAKSKGAASPTFVDEEPVYPSRILQNLLVILLLLPYAGVYIVTFFHLYDIPTELGFAKPKEGPGGIRVNVKDQDKEALAQLVGSWVIDSAEENGKAIDTLKGAKFTFTEEKKLTWPEGKDLEFILKAGENPKQIDIYAPKSVFAGIFEIDGDTVKLCLGKETARAEIPLLKPADRPSKFDSKEGRLYLLKRGKAKEDVKSEGDENKKEAARLGGAWIVDSVTIAGKPNDAAKGQKYAFADDKVTYPNREQHRFSVDSSKSPKWIDIHSGVLPEKGIYKLDGDDLQLCLAGPMEITNKEGKSVQTIRPTDFDSKQGTLLVLKREGAKKKDDGEPKVGAASIDGGWKVESMEILGKADKGRSGRFVFANGKVKDPDGDDGMVKIDDSKDPKQLDVVFKKGSLTGIYKIEGDTLHWAFGFPGKDGSPGPRPEAFDSKAGIYAVLKRMSKEELNAPVVNHRKSQNNLKQLVLALHGYFDSYKHLPPAAIYDPSGKPLLSWRVAILPYIEQGALYKEFDLTKPWDDPHNKKLLEKMPQIYVASNAGAKGGMTHYRALVGPGTVLEPQKSLEGKLVGRKLGSIPDGTSNCIVIVEATNAIEWTRPDDLPYDPKGPLPKFGIGSDGFNAAFADGVVRCVSAKVPENVLRPYLTCDNGMPRAPLDSDKETDKEIEKEKAKESGKVAATKSQLKVLTTATEAFYVKNSQFPQALVELLRKDATGAGPYLASPDALVDPWGNQYQYNPVGERNSGMRPDIWTVTPTKETIGNWAKVLDK